MKKLTEKKALELSIEMWTWLHQNPLKDKMDYPKYKKQGISQYFNRCPCCQYYTCNDCPLDFEGPYQGKCAGGAFFKWHSAQSIKTSKKNSAIILKALQDKYAQITEKKEKLDGAKTTRKASNNSKTDAKKETRGQRR